MSTPPRLDQPVKYLTAPLPVVERALISRAEVLELQPEGDQATIPMTVQDVRVIVAHELRSLAEELHHYR